MEKSKNQMLNSDWESLIDKWKKLHSEGSFELATQFYYDELFDIVVERFKDNFSLSRDQETLISLLGFSPEPIILTAKALNPKNHYIITTKNINICWVIFLESDKIIYIIVLHIRGSAHCFYINR